MPQHTYQILTKRAQRLASLASRLEWPENVWMGVSVETERYACRVDYLRHVPAAVRFVSAEPLLAPLANLNLDGIDWLIAGGESQSGCRASSVDWFRDLRDQCTAAGVAFFLKQLGGHPSKRGGDDAVLDGRRWVEMPRGNRNRRVKSSPSSTAGDSRCSVRSASLSRFRRQNTANRADFP